MFYQVNTEISSDTSESVAKVLIELVSSGLGQSVVFILVAAVVGVIYLRMGKSNNDVLSNAIEKISPDTDLFENLQDRIKDLEDKKGNCQKELSSLKHELEILKPLPKKVEAMEQTLKEIEGIVS